MNIIEYEQQQSIAYVKLNRPDVLNAFNFEMLCELQAIVESIRIHPDIRLVIITGAGDKAFSVGADLKERQTLPEPLVKRNLNKFAEVFNAIEALPQPTICALNGYAFGGGLELALACDFRIAAKNAVVGLTETKLGIIPGAGGTQRLPRLIGEAKALEFILTAKKIAGEEALACGLFTQLVEQEHLMQATESFANTILQNAPIALQQAKFAVKQGMKVDLQTGLQIERKAYEITLPTEDRIEALNAFVEKRAPQFKGK
ncbi:enoyl-CoA hydratase-related protein [Metasolibacillus sp.]|uniref:enoyl-CoA hydratase-related protein n=1 Tax=Metasolibacillus sp. TaxID=2703680 RepID=UPI0025D34307|nr:enoyl-CoA hydratase-related protein [Metasolibacillus sp.]MCT6924630.1 enoyl-CoA hydratase-related protein [Metasolibacillus sp.]MCT6940832.1 enoyl-CoA hydratase-related protein [Metasolibacillus sp.]